MRQHRGNRGDYGIASAADIEYLARIGAKGGKKSRRKLTKKDAKAMAEKRWGKK